ncbi:MAG TPA: beta-propeller fold lactonase family protein, partial [Candidatus Baltobacteraceae bacterium]
MRFRTLVAALCGAAVLCTAAGAQVVSRRLPTEWFIAPPSGAVATTLTLPLSATLTADGRHLIVTEGGEGTPGIRILDPSSLALQREIPMHAVYGVPLPDLTGAGFWVSAAGDDMIVHGDAESGTIDRKIMLSRGCWPSAIARARGAVGFLYIPCESANSIALVNEPDAAMLFGETSILHNLGSHPAGIVVSPDGRYAYVALWGGHEIAVIDYQKLLLGKAQAPVLARRIDVGLHPEALAISNDGSRLYVSVADDDAISVIDTTTFSVRSKTNVGLFNDRVIGASPAALALSPDETRLYVACAAANAVAVMSIQGDELRTIGALPTGWYPTALTLSEDGQALLVADGKGEGSRANPQFAPFSPGRSSDSGYVAASLVGSIRRLPIPDAKGLAANISAIRANAGPRMNEALDMPGVSV